MIKKFLICGKQLYFQSKKVESFNELGNIIELVMPIQSYWTIEENMKYANYLLASGEASAEVLNVYKKIFSTCAPYAVYEKDRIWLNTKARD
jgi:hypothetical protein